ncbi:tubulin-tyrosine ligase [Diplodia corticola]|uniref:Tubulin-tyrosine ligase n=1 Tax=Diplodia corticola TaxID=236234 RepID=A0A1J9RV53_9PEZI|nr:tubulin-tyrosine ligase [Diplodia corticola]OJD32279.1 tubulin-tyrosine ligase [Diplodia corticola]
MSEVMTESISRISLAGGRQQVYCLVKHEDPQLQPLVVAAFKARLPAHTYTIIGSLDEYPGGPLLQIAAKDALDFDKAFHQPRMLINTYVTRDALTRKHLLGQTYAAWTAKHPGCLLQTNVKTIANLEINPAESIYDVLDNTPLGRILEANEDKHAAERVWWMLRPDLSDGSQDLRLFSTVDELQAAFDDLDAQYEQEQQHAQEKKQADDAQQAAADHDSKALALAAAAGDGADDKDDCDAQARQSGGWSSWFHITVTTEEHTDVVAPKRHVVAQRYVSRPLTFDGCKFQVSAYVLAVGALRVFVYRPLLALFAAKPFSPPWDSSASADLAAHSTYDGNVRLFWDLPDRPAGWKQSVFAQICAITGEVFSAASTREISAHFQPLPQAFELFAVNFAVDAAGKAMLADIRASPDMLHQTECGTKLSGLVQGLFEEVADVAVRPFFDGEAAAGSERLVKVVDLDTKKI